LIFGQEGRREGMMREEKKIVKEWGRKLKINRTKGVW
jgi:hypothetical protein